MANVVRTWSFLLALLLLGAGPPRFQSPFPVVFEAPAGVRPAGPFEPAKPFAQVLPSGRIVNPVGDSVFVGMNALGFALTPDGRYAIVSNDDARESDEESVLDPLTRGGSSLAVVDTRMMKLADRYSDPEEQFFVGVAAFADPADPRRTLVLASGGLNNEVYVFDLDEAGRLRPDARPRIAVPAPMDEGFENFGHALPATIVTARNGERAYVVNALGGSLSTIDTRTRALVGSSPSVGFFPYGASVAGDRLLVTNEGLMRYAKVDAPSVPQFGSVKPDLERASSLSFVPMAGDGSLLPRTLNVPMDQAPDGVTRIGGAHPTAVVTSPDQTYAYVAMANVDRIATVLLKPFPRVVGGTELRLYARSPYGTQPNALALSKDGKRLYVALAGIDAVAVLDASDPHKLHRIGLLPTGWYPTAIELSSDDRFLFVINSKGVARENGSGLWSTLQRIDMRAVDLRKTTRAALADLHVTHMLIPNGIVPQTFAGKSSSAIKHVVLIEESLPYDAGPNVRSLAATFGLADNFYIDVDEPGARREFEMGGIADVYTEKMLGLRNGRAFSLGGDPEDYPRCGYIFNSLALARKTYRYYGDIGVNGSDAPTLAALNGHIDMNYPQLSTATDDTQRANEFMRDFYPLAKSGNMPAFTLLRLPDAADGDRAVGAIVQYLTHLPEWRQTAIFVVSDDVRPESHAYAIVVSPYGKRHYASTHHYSTVSVLKTEEEILGLPPLSLGDMLTSDMRDFFTARVSVAPFSVAFDWAPST